MKVSRIVLSLALLWMASPLVAQTIQLAPRVIASAGTHFQNAQFELSYTIGELAAVSTVGAGNVKLTQGFHQPDKFTIAAVESAEAYWAGGVFPNPADDMVRLQLLVSQHDEIQIELLDASGRLVSVMPVHHVIPGSQSMEIPLQGLSSGIYLLRVSSTDRSRQSTFRIQKSHS